MEMLTHWSHPRPSHPDRPDDRSLGQKAADNVASLVGSWPFIIGQSIILFLWIALNVFEFLFRPWDPYPFILLNLFLSFQAAYTGPIVMMSQNRQAARDREEAHADYLADIDTHTHVLEIERIVRSLNNAP